MAATWHIKVQGTPLIQKYRLGMHWSSTVATWWGDAGSLKFCITQNLTVINVVLISPSPGQSGTLGHTPNHHHHCLNSDLPVVLVGDQRSPHGWQGGHRLEASEMPCCREAVLAHLMRLVEALTDLAERHMDLGYGGADGREQCLSLAGEIQQGRRQQLS
jgi:hypothetical protein